ncbi:chemotaxis protein CheR [bacterium]|nr:chemotaxis protein CheR [bacterium]
MNGLQSLDKTDFNRLSAFIESEYGIKMPSVKKTMLESRLLKRLRHLQIPDFRSYCEYLFSAKGRKEELPHFISKVTTNKTDFFREPDHFSYLTNVILPRLLYQSGNPLRQINLWSAGCSSGEEAYTLAMVISEYAENNPETPFNFSILATDISDNVLSMGRKAIYHVSRIDPIPFALRRKYLLKSRDREKPVVKMVPEIRKLVKFEKLNLMDKDFGIKQNIHVAFCRNVIIYFNKEIQETILNKITKCLVPEGYLFQGHSESTQGMRLPLRSVHPTIFQKVN